MTGIITVDYGRFVSRSHAWVNGPTGVPLLDVHVLFADTTVPIILGEALGCCFAGKQIQVVVGMVPYGPLLAQSVARALSATEGEHDEIKLVVIQRGSLGVMFTMAELDPLLVGKNVLVVAPVVAEGFKRHLDMATHLAGKGANVAGVGAICSYGQVAVPDGVHFASLISYEKVPRQIGLAL